jgi:hypothetical protein
MKIKADYHFQSAFFAVPAEPVVIPIGGRESVASSWFEEFPEAQFLPAKVSYP